MAELEAELGVQATYLLMTESVFYNLASPEGAAAIARLRELGHAVGLHAVYPNAVLDERFDPVVSWHNPSPRAHVRRDPRCDQRVRSALLLAGDVPIGLESALAIRLPARGASRGCVPVAPDPRPSGDLGLSRARRWARRCARWSKPRQRAPPRPAGRRRHRPCVTSPLRVVHCPVNTAGVPWANVQALRRRGVDAQLVVFNRYTLHPEADRSLERQRRLGPPPADPVARARSTSSRAPTSSTSTSASRSSRGRCSFRSSARSRKKSVHALPRFGHPWEVARRSSPSGRRLERSSSARTTRFAGFPRRR